jgi:hypothetical protein
VPAGRVFSGVAADAMNLGSGAPDGSVVWGRALWEVRTDARKTDSSASTTWAAGSETLVHTHEL